MAKRPTPKKRQSKSSSSRRYKEYENRAQKKIKGMVDYMLTLKKRGNLKATVKKESEKVTKIKA